jgi:hypothetical protein
MDADGIYDDELAILIAQRKKKVDYFHFDTELQLNNCINNYFEVILSSNKGLIESQEVQKPEEDKKPEHILYGYFCFCKEQNLNSPSNTMAKKRKKDDIKTSSSKSPIAREEKQLQAVMETTTTVKPLQH